MKFTSNYVSVVLDDDETFSGLDDAKLLVCTGDQQDVWSENYDMLEIKNMGAETIYITDLIDAAVAAGVVIEDLYDPPAHRGTFIETEFMKAEALLEAKATEERMKKAVNWDREMLDGNTD